MSKKDARCAVSDDAEIQFVKTVNRGKNRGEKTKVSTEPGKAKGRFCDDIVQSSIQSAPEADVIEILRAPNSSNSYFSPKRTTDGFKKATVNRSIASSARRYENFVPPTRNRNSLSSATTVSIDEHLANSESNANTGQGVLFEELSAYSPRSISVPSTSSMPIQTNLYPQQLPSPTLGNANPFTDGRNIIINTNVYTNSQVVHSFNT